MIGTLQCPNRADNPPRATESGSSLVQPRLRGAMNTKGYPRDSATAQAAAERSESAS